MKKFAKKAETQKTICFLYELCYGETMACKEAKKPGESNKTAAKSPKSTALSMHDSSSTNYLE